VVVKRSKKEVRRRVLADAAAAAVPGQGPAWRVGCG
jgi:hypothetical protein